MSLRRREFIAGRGGLAARGEGAAAAGASDRVSQYWIR
jgi:hypothetical protein